ncbi:MAG: radical SAM/SPASM domain-containing protein, partial [Candidatus Muiribacteriota bacterium]
MQDVNKNKISNNNKLDSIIFGICEKCNLNCIYCPQSPAVYGNESLYSDIFKKDRKTMKLNVFKKAYNNINNECEEFHFVGFGEPLLNPEFINIFEHALNNNNSKFEKFYIFTNALLLSSDLTDNIVEIVKKSRETVYFIFSVGTDNEITYKNLKGVNGLKKVKNNIIYFLKEAFNNNLLGLIRVSVQFIVLEENFNETSEFINFWKNEFNNLNHKFVFETSSGAELTFETPLGISIIEALTIFQNKSHNLYKKNLKENNLIYLIKNLKKQSLQRVDYDNTSKANFLICPALWKQPFVNADGIMSICCRDINSEETYGNLKEKKFLNLFNSDVANKYRLLHITNQKDEIYRCKNCPGIKLDPVSDEEIKNHLFTVNKERFYFLYKNEKKFGFKFDYRYINIQNYEVFKSFLTNSKINFICVIKADKIIENVKNLYEFPGLKTEEIPSTNEFEPCMYMFEHFYFEDDG